MDRPRPRGADPERGAALLTVMMFLFVVALIAAVTSVAGISSLNNSRRDLAGAAAAATSNAGVAEAMAYLRSHSVGALDCTEPVVATTNTSWENAAGCTANPWTDPIHPQTVSGGVAGAACGTGQDCYRVWIGTLQPYQAPQGPLGAPGSTPARPAIVRIHATGRSGAGPAGRSATAEVSIIPSRFPIGVYGTSFSMHAHHSPITNESLFTAGDIALKCPLTGWDPEYNLPAAVHAAGTITYQTSSCGGGFVPANSGGTGKCDTAQPYDQASTGGAFPTSSACYNYDTTDSQFSALNPPIAPYPQTSLFDANELAKYGYRPEGLSQQDYSRLRTTAMTEHTYNVTGSTLTTALQNLVSQGVTDPVVYDDNGTAPSTGDFPSTFFRSANPSGSCPPWGLTIIVKNGSMHWSTTSTTPLVASVFVPDGTYTATGQASVIGTLFAQNMSFEGRGNFQLDSCFVANPPAGVLALTLLNYHTVDTGTAG